VQFLKQLWDSVRRISRNKDALIAVFSGMAIFLHLLLRFLLKVGPLDLLPLYTALIAGGVPLIIALLRQLWKRQFGSDLLAGISIVTGVLLHEYLVACIVVLMLSGGSALEQYATSRASSALRSLARRMPTTAHLLTAGGFVTIDAQNIVPGNLISVFPHEICPVDGEVVEGYGDMDESYLTGEPFRISKAPGSQVLSGAVNGNTALKMRATKLPVDSRFSRILKVVEDAEKNRPAMRRIADRLGAWYTPAALLLAGLGSAVPDVAEAVLVNEPLVGAVTVTVKVVEAPLARLAMAGKVTMPLLLIPPPEAETKVTAAGKLSITTTLLAVEGPLLVTVMV